MIQDNRTQKYHVLTRGVILADNHLLVAHCIGMDNTFLPGGHVEFRESIRTSLRREINEELGLKCEVGPYIGAVEAEYEDEGIYHQEINHVFAAKLEGAEYRKNPPSQESHLEFYWIPVNEMDRHNLLPQPMRRIVENYINEAEGPFFESTFE
ncbi:NUDIX domain-containing protein [Paenibacillus sp. DMB20]|uniref:NUDIX domain-containing protein n=1 Tax=Paenibacillus sp. DMB20 TaxID=1642570 RepID=UPI00062772ED|nr:NUDIX domain-containing protein [Paenibacillus sp. DMB20]KKO51232.1 NUDIX hydrolase [Paenibacillus sp. DMB20]